MLLRGMGQESTVRRIYGRSQTMKRKSTVRRIYGRSQTMKHTRNPTNQ